MILLLYVKRKRDGNACTSLIGLGREKQSVSNQVPFVIFYAWGIQCVECWHIKKDKLPYSFSTGQNDVQFVDIYKRQAADKLMTNSTHSEGQSRSSGPADAVKQTAD